MGEVVAFRRAVPEPEVVLTDQGRPVVGLTADGRVTMAPDMDEASRALWEAVEVKVHEAWEETTIPRLMAQVRLLAPRLDEVEPGWRENMKRESRRG